MDEMHSIELERKLRLPDPTKAMEGLWRLIRRTRQQVNVRTTVGGSPSVSWQAVDIKKRAKLDADRRKAAAVFLAYRSTFR